MARQTHWVVKSAMPSDLVLYSYPAASLAIFPVIIRTFTGGEIRSRVHRFANGPFSMTTGYSKMLAAHWQNVITFTMVYLTPGPHKIYNYTITQNCNLSAISTEMTCFNRPRKHTPQTACKNAIVMWKKQATKKHVIQKSTRKSPNQQIFQFLV